MGSQVKVVVLIPAGSAKPLRLIQLTRLAHRKSAQLELRRRRHRKPRSIARRLPTLNTPSRPPANQSLWRTNAASLSTVSTTPRASSGTIRYGAPHCSRKFRRIIANLFKVYVPRKCVSTRESHDRISNRNANISSERDRTHHQ
jgi:hypothetical protein